jgi:hypothetical protein
MRGALRLSLALLVAVPLVLSAVAAKGADARGPARVAPRPAPVPSLEPAKTQVLWRKVVSSRRVSATAAECRPLRAVFYAATDWLRLATKLAGAGSPCSEYYISIPPLVADKTLMRPDQAWRIRALGPRFHALAEVHFSTWSRWVADTGSTWHAAGVTARQRMATAGFDVAQGDSWVVNELGSAVRRGDGNARANVREFLRGLYEGDGTRPTRGAVFVIGFGQAAADVSVYQNTLQHWLADSAFWTEMAAYVSDWSQEVYGDVRSHAVAGSPTATRREYLNDYLQHKLVLAGAGPPEVEPARAYLRESHSPLANAAWQYDASYGWTAVSAEQMAAYVSAQVNALRHFSATTGQARDRWGFAWAPKNATGATGVDFAAQTSLVLDRMAAAIRDSGDVVQPESPGSGACGPPGIEAWCALDVDAARHSVSWQSFRSWASSAIGFTTPARTILAGEPSAQIGLALVTTTGARVTSSTAVRVATVRSSSASGAFSTSPAGPWTPTLELTLPADADGLVHYRDTRAGTHTITASADGSLTGAQTVAITAGPVATVAVTPVSGVVHARGARSFVAAARDAYGNAVRGPVSWRVAPARLGKVKRAAGGRATFTAQRVVRKGRVIARFVSGGRAVSGSASVVVRPGRLRIGALGHRRTRAGARVTFRAVDAARKPISRAVVVALVRREGLLERVRVRTGPAGRAQLRIRRLDGCATVRVTGASAAGFRWDARRPRARVCA